MIKKGRQMGKTLAEIRDDHVNRYVEAASFAKKVSARSIADIGCGMGYGSYILAENTGLPVMAYDIDKDAIEFGNENWGHPNIKRRVADLANLSVENEWAAGGVDLIVGFEILEHFVEAPSFIKRHNELAWYFVGSVPNQELIPFDASKHKYHVRHYTPEEIVRELAEGGWRVRQLGCQVGKRGEEGNVDWTHTNGRTIVFIADSV